MAAAIYPVYDICNLHTDILLQDLISVERFENYLAKNPHLQGVHTHTFYHWVYFEKGSGTHTIDFDTFEVKKGMFYAMKPGQVHSWDFRSKVDGIVVNFSPLFFDKLQMHSGLLDQFRIFGGDTRQQVIRFAPKEQSHIAALCQRILSEKERPDELSYLSIANTLLKLFILADRKTVAHTESSRENHSHYAHFRRFEQLLETEYKQLKLPKSYAERLFLTPHLLNAICNTYAGASAGVLIRNRVLLEAKRLLVNFNLQINEIAFELDFSDASNFNKFFKKHCGITPEQFRNKYRIPKVP